MVAATVTVTGIIMAVRLGESELPGAVHDDQSFGFADSDGHGSDQKSSEQSEQKMNISLCSSRDRLSCARSRDSRHAITLEGKALVTPFG
jgi:hypothetical protein